MIADSYDKVLFKKALDNLSNAYCPYSEFPVSAVLVGESGKEYTGVNIENAAYPAGICAERTAMSKAVSEGERNFERIVIATAKGEGWPCGICRQLMYEFSPDMKVVAGKNIDNLKAYSLRELLPEGFRLEV